jgi:hypothetical protein
MSPANGELQMPYKVLIAIVHPKVKHQWWSDQKEFVTLALARNHRRLVAERWNDCDTAIAAPDGRLLYFEESLKDQKELAELLKA